MKYVSVFYEGEHNDARTNLAIAFTAAMYGAAISNYAKAAFVLCEIRFLESLSSISHCPCFRCFGVKVERILFDDKGIARGAEAGLVVYVVSPRNRLQSFTLRVGFGQSQSGCPAFRNQSAFPAPSGSWEIFFKYNLGASKSYLGTF